MQSVLLPARRHIAPIITLLLFAPIIGEFLFGSTHLTTLFYLLPQTGVYGCGALLIRDMVRRQRKGWLAILLLGVAFGVTEECVILQSSLSQLFAADPAHIYGRIFGVNWMYLLWAVGYETLWCVILPIQLTELIFPEQRDEPWLGRWGMIIAGIIFVLSSLAAWYLWTQIGLPKMGATYHAPLPQIFGALIVIAVLIIVALVPWPPSQNTQKVARLVPWPWLIGPLATIVSVFWFVLIFLHFGVAPTLPAIVPALISLVWAAGAFLLIKFLSASRNWQNAHRVAIIFGALIASMLAGFLISGVSLPLDVLGKAVLNLIAIIGLSYLAWKLRRRKISQEEAPLSDLEASTAQNITENA